MRGLSILFALIALLSAAAYIWFSSEPVETASADAPFVPADAPPMTDSTSPPPVPAPAAPAAASDAGVPANAMITDSDNFGAESLEFDAPFAPATTNADSSKALRQDFRTRPVAYNRPPSTMALNRPVDISLVIDATPEGAPVTGLEGFEGEIIERDVDLSDVVAAQLTGPAFEIIPLSVKRQKLSPRAQNRWQWRVTPTETGEHTLILEIFGYAPGVEAAEPLDAYRDKIAVEVRQLDQLVSFARENEPVFGALAAIAGVLSALFGFIRWRMSRKT
ncbi:MAG: hypothetical protein AAF719_07285 [Pseudomonadota bacterium]